MSASLGIPTGGWGGCVGRRGRLGQAGLEMPGGVFSDVLDKVKSTKGVSSDVDLDVDDLKLLVTTFKDAVREHSGHEFPQHPREQLDMAINAVFDSWNSDRMAADCPNPG